MTKNTFPQRNKIWTRPSEARGVDLPTKILRILSAKGRLTASQIGQRIMSLNNQEGTVRIHKMLVILKEEGKVSCSLEKNSSGMACQYWTATNSLDSVNSVNLVNDKTETALHILVAENKRLKATVAQYKAKFAALDKLLTTA